MTAYHKGTKAFYDCFSGLVPCTVVSVNKPGRGCFIAEGEIVLRVDEDFKGYRKGELIETSAKNAPPRKHRVIRESFYRIKTNYQYS